MKNSFGVTVSTKMLSVHARRLPIPSVMYEHNFLTPDLAEWNLQGKKFINQVPIEKWSYLRLDCPEISDSIWRNFQRALKDCRMGEEQPSTYEGFFARLSGHGDDDKNDKAIGDAIEKAKEKGLRILWVILPYFSAAIYARVKFWADVKCGTLEANDRGGSISDKYDRHPYCLRTL